MLFPLFFWLSVSFLFVISADFSSCLGPALIDAEAGAGVVPTRLRFDVRAGMRAPGDASHSARATRLDPGYRLVSAHTARECGSPRWPTPHYANGGAGGAPHSQDLPAGGRLHHATEHQDEV